MNYVFTDTETTSRDPKFGSLLEVAAILCNDNFQVLDEPFVAKCSLRPGTIPEVGALLVTNTTPQILKKRNLSHYEMIKQMMKVFTKWSPAIWTGWNVIDFDFEFYRSTFYKTLNEVYFHQFHGNKRSDVLVTARAANLFYPGCLKIPMNEQGKQNFKLDQISLLNGIKHDAAHSALSDTQAVFEMAKLIKEKAPNLWKASLMTCSKTEINQIVEKEKIFVTAETYYGKTVPFVLTFCCYHPKYSYAMSMDLKHHPENYINLPYEQLKAELKKSPKILRTVRNNKFVVLMNGNYAKNLDGYKQIGIEKLIERANIIAANKEFKDRVSKILLEEADEKEMLDTNLEQEPEEQIYSGGFNKTPKDEKLILEFHEKNDWKEKFLISEKFDDSRFIYFAQRLIYEESPTSLPETVYKKIHRKIAEQINSLNDEKWNTLAKSTKEIDDLRVKHENDEQKLKLLDDIDEFLDEIKQKYENA